MMEFAGWDMPVHYGSIVEEHKAVRSVAGAFDVSHMGEIELSGPGAEDSCSRLFTNDASRLEPGRSQYSLLVDDAGRVLDDVIVYRLGPELFFVCVNAANARRDSEWIAARASASTEVRDRSDDLALIAFQGPSARRLASSLAEDLAELRRFDVSRTTIGRCEVTAAVTGYTGEDGFEFFVEVGGAGELWESLLSVSIGEDAAVPVGLGARDTLRLEAALPLYGHELSEDITPYEAGLGWAVKLSRDDKIGFDALSDLASSAPARRLIGLEASGGIPRHGCPILHDGRPVGAVTSGTYSPSLGKPLALALVEAHAIDGDLSVDIRGRTCDVVVTSLPFYVRQH